MTNAATKSPIKPMPKIDMPRIKQPLGWQPHDMSDDFRKPTGLETLWARFDRSVWLSGEHPDHPTFPTYAAGMLALVYPKRQSARAHFFEPKLYLHHRLVHLDWFMPGMRGLFGKSPLPGLDEYGRWCPPGADYEVCPPDRNYEEWLPAECMLDDFDYGRALDARGEPVPRGWWFED